MAAADDDWEPLSEADMKLLEARRERADQISKRMGDYLLKGYKMLAICCPVCDTILLQTRDGENYCVACSELNSDADKDNPALNPTAALSMAREIERSTEASSASKTDVLSAASSPSPRHQPPPITPLMEIDTQQPASTLQQRPITAANDPDPSSLDTLGKTPVDIHCWPTETAQVLHTQSDSASARSGIRVDFGGDGDGLGYQKSGPQGQITIKALTKKIKWSTQQLGSTASVEYSLQLCQLIKAASEAVVSVKNSGI